MKYLILTVEDAAKIARALPADGPLGPIAARLKADTGADIEDIVARLKAFDACAPCVIEGFEESCCAWEAQKQGRRLRRLLERARGERPPGNTESMCSEPAADGVARELQRLGVDVYRRPVTEDRHTWAVYGVWYSERHSKTQNERALVRLRTLPDGTSADEAIDVLREASR